MLEHERGITAEYLIEKIKAATVSYTHLDVYKRQLNGLPTGGVSLQGHVAVGGAFLGNAHGAGV